MDRKWMNYGFVILCLGIVTVGIMFASKYSPGTRIKITAPKGQGSIEVEIKDRKIDVLDILELIFKDNHQEKIARTFLKEKGIFHIEDKEIVEHLAKMFPDKEEGDFIKKQEELNILLNKYPIIEDIREKAEKHESPFQFVGRKVIIGTPDKKNEKPKPKEVYVSVHSELAGKLINVTNPNNPQREMVLWGIPKIYGTNVIKNIHINNEQAKYLFGIDFLPPEGRSGFANIAGVGEAYDPSCKIKN